MKFGWRWKGHKEQTFCCPACAQVFRSKYYDVREPKGAIGTWQATHMYVKNCPKCGWLSQVVDMQETKDGFIG
jgi:predicted RNA-binding Zn-ribbon protein involved in translation (DUF1610 family)